MATTGDPLFVNDRIALYFGGFVPTIFCAAIFGTMFSCVELWSISYNRDVRYFQNFLIGQHGPWVSAI